jgi:hypothetical protein
MGSQQLLIIALGVILVGVAVVVGVNLFSVSFADQVKDLAIHKVTEIGVRANLYKKTPTASGGGGGSYKGFDAQLSSLLKEDEIVKKFALRERDNMLIISMTLQNRGENKRLFRVWARNDSDGLERLRIYEPDSEKWVWVFKRK